MFQLFGNSHDSRTTSRTRTGNRQRRLESEWLESRHLLTGIFLDTGQNLGDGNTRDVALGDLDGDGDQDAFVANFGGDQDQVWLNDGVGVFSAGQSVGGSTSTSAVDLGDVDGDGDLDAFLIQYSGGGRLWINSGNATFIDSGQVFGQSSGGNDVKLGDLDSDGDLDAVVANDNGQPNTVWINDGSGNFADSGQQLGADYSQEVALGDLDGDGDVDAFFANHGPDNSGDCSLRRNKCEYHPDSVWLNDGTGYFSDSGQEIGIASDLNMMSQAVSLGDFDLDGDLDAFVINGGFGGPSSNAKPNLIWVNDGSGNFTDSGQRMGSSRSEGLAIGDLDGDGDLDALVGATYIEGLPPSEVWLNDGTGVFHDSGQDLPQKSTWAPALGDLDGDGDLDAFLGNRDYVDPHPSNSVLLNGNASVVVTPIAGLVTGEDGAYASFSVVLAAQPVAGTNVVFSVSSTDTSEGTIVGATSNLLTLTFDDTSWQLPQTIVVQGVDDALVDGNTDYSIITSPVISTDPKFDGYNPSDVTLQNVDNDSPSLTIMHVADIDASTSSAQRGKWNALVTVTVVDAHGTPVANATVTGQWSNGTSGASTCVTDVFGVCTIAKNNLKKNLSSVTFAVTDIAIQSYLYDPDANEDSDGDSDGTEITILNS